MKIVTYQDVFESLPLVNDLIIFLEEVDDHNKYSQRLEKMSPQEIRLVELLMYIGRESIEQSFSIKDTNFTQLLIKWDKYKSFIGIDRSKSNILGKTVVLRESLQKAVEMFHKK